MCVCIGYTEFLIYVQVTYYCAIARICLLTTCYYVQIAFLIAFHTVMTEGRTHVTRVYTPHAVP